MSEKTVSRQITETEVHDNNLLIHFLDSLEIPSGHGWQLRRSSCGKGWRLLTTSRMPNYDSASAAIWERLDHGDNVELFPPLLLPGDRKPTMDELEKILEGEDDRAIGILPSGEIVELS